MAGGSMAGGPMAGGPMAGGPMAGGPSGWQRMGFLQAPRPGSDERLGQRDPADGNNIIRNKGHNQEWLAAPWLAAPWLAAPWLAAPWPLMAPLGTFLFLQRGDLTGAVVALKTVIHPWLAARWLAARPLMAPSGTFLSLQRGDLTGAIVALKTVIHIAEKGLTPYGPLRRVIIKTEEYVAKGSTERMLTWLRKGW